MNNIMYILPAISFWGASCFVCGIEYHSHFTRPYRTSVVINHAPVMLMLNSAVVMHLKNYCRNNVLISGNSKHPFHKLQILNEPYTLSHSRTNVTSVTLVIACATCVFSHTFKKEHHDWCIKDASCSVYSWARSVMSRLFSGWDKV